MGRKGKFVPIRALSQTIERLLAGAQNGIALEKLFKLFSKKFPNETPNRFFDAVSIVIQKGQYVLDSEVDRLVPRPYRGVVIFRPGFEPLVIIEEEKRKVPLSFSSAFCALPGDVLEGYLVYDKSRDCEVFEAKRVLYAPMTEIVGQVRVFRKGGRKKATFVNRRFEGISFTFTNEEKAIALDGQFVCAKIIRRPESSNSSFLIECVGAVENQSALGVELEEALRVFNLPHAFSQKTQNEVAKFASEVLSRDKRGRTDLTALDFCTIDGADARDFDDAVFAQKSKTGYRLIVAIADVSYYVKPLTAIDEDAQLRSTSVYFPRKVIPMLPEVLSNGLCSLNPGLDRLVFVCDMEITIKGEIASYRFYRAVIRSKARLTYDQVYDALFAKEKVAISGMMRRLTALKKVYEILRKAREARLAMDFESAESVFMFDDENEVSGVIDKPTTDANRLIEECMLAANVCAATFIANSGQESLYRVHPEPSEEKLQTLQESLSELGIGFHLGEGAIRGIDATLQAVKGTPQASAVQMLILRAMMRASYSPKNVGHYGLQYPLYTHFTSPIRRYPDLLVHRTIAGILEKKAYKPVVYDTSRVTLDSVQGRSVTQNEKDDAGVKDKNWVTLGFITSACERRAEDAERDIDKWLKCQYLERLMRTQDAFEGRISSVTPFGFFVELDGIGLEGLVHISEIGEDYYVCEGSAIVGTSTPERFAIGQAVRVRVARLSVEDRSVDFVLLRPKDSVRKGKKHGK